MPVHAWQFLAIPLIGNFELHRLDPMPLLGRNFRMKKISLKMIRKSFNLNKSKEDGKFVVVQQPGLAADFTKEDSLFGGCYSKEFGSCNLNGEVEENRSKSESLMGTLKRRLSAKQKSKVKASSPVGCIDDDTFSSSSAPISFNEVKAQHPLRSTSLRNYHYSPTPWPLRPANSEETCIKMEVKVKALAQSSNPSPVFNGVCKEFHDFQMEALFQDPSESLKNSEPQIGNLHLNIDEHVPAVIGITPPDYIQYTMPLDEGMYHVEGSHSYCLDGSLPMEVMPQVDRGFLHVDEGLIDEDLVMSPDMFMEPSVNGLLIGSTGVMLQSSTVNVPSPLLPPFVGSQYQRNFPSFRGFDTEVTERIRHHLHFDPSSAPGVNRVYDSVQNSGPMVVTSLTEELKKLAKQGWYWGPITRWEAEEKLVDLLDGSFLVRDSSDDRYLLSLSFRSQGKTLHTRIEHSNGRFSFYEQPDLEGHISIVNLIEHSIKDSESGAFCYSRSRLPGSATYPVSLTNPVSRFMQVRSLQYLCRFIIRQYTRIDLIQKLPLPNKMKDYLQEKHY